MEEFLTGVVQSTFSIAVAAYLLVRMEARLDGLTEAITRLRAAIERRDFAPESSRDNDA